MEIERESAVLDLLLLRRPPAEAAEQLRSFPFDSTDAVRLTADEVRHVLTQYLEGNLGGGEVQDWASTVEGRDDIELDPSQADLLSSVLFELATPEINRTLTTRVAQDWLRLLHPA